MSGRAIIRSKINAKANLGGTGGGGGTGTAVWGSFWHTLDQIAASTTTAYAVKFNTADPSNNGVTVSNDPLGDPTKITVANSGVYNIQFSLQLENTDIQIHDAQIWLRLNGTGSLGDVPDTNGELAVINSHGGNPGLALPAWNYVIKLNAGDFIQLMWRVDNTSITMQSYPAGTSPVYPATPSAIITVTQVTGVVSGGGGGSAIAVSDEGTLLTPTVTSFNFTGAGVTATAVGNAITVNVPPSTTTSNIIADLTVGAINAGDTVPSGTNLQQFAELLLYKTFFPTFVSPTFSLVNDAGAFRETGSAISILTLTFNFNRGQIVGALSGGIWNPALFQNFRSGAASTYVINGSTQVSNVRLILSYVVLNGTNSFTATVNYLIGPQPLDSKNNPYLSPLPAGTSPTQTTSFQGIYPYFYLKSASPITAASMQSAIVGGTATKVVGDSTGTIIIPYNATGEYIAVAYPDSSPTKTIWYVNALDNGAIPGGVFGAATTLACTSPTGLWTGINYKIHVSPGLITQANPIELRN